MTYSNTQATPIQSLSDLVTQALISAGLITNECAAEFQAELASGNITASAWPSYLRHIPSGGGTVVQGTTAQPEESR